MSIDATDGLHRTALHYAAGRGRLEVVDALLNKGARVDTAGICVWGEEGGISTDLVVQSKENA